MISILSVGIQKYISNTLPEVSCALLDSKRVYDAFSDILNEAFSEHTSICLNNISSDAFKGVLSSYRFLYSKEQETDILILYFSGHAVTNNNNYTLCFSDYNENYGGYLSVEELAQLLNSICCEKIIILDCCFSGNGLNLANDSIFKDRISIITSSSQHGLADFDESGSKFTKSLCESIYEIKSENIDFTLNELQNRICSKHRTSCFNMGAGQTGSVLLKQCTNLEAFYFDFDKRFYNRISKSDRFFREASWYSLSGLPFTIAEKVYKEIFLCFNSYSKYPLEASWLVRRAMGSSISCIENKHNRLYIAKKLISSSFWQEQCIGIIGARYDFENDDGLFEFLKQKIENNIIRKIDVVWLANLYTAENERYDYNVFINSSLATNSWGIQEIFRAASKHRVSIGSFNNSLNTILKNSFSETIQNARKEWQRINFNSEKSNAVLYNVIDNKSPRGRLPKNSRAKFILSTLYGNWRGNKALNLRNYFESQNSEDIEQELTDAANYAEIEFRMAIFDYLATNPDLTNQYLKSISWGFNDEHPWVRRSAIQAFKVADIEQDIINKSIIDYFSSHPNENIGEFDLILEYIEKDSPENSTILSFIKENQNRFSRGDYRSIAFSIYNYFDD